MISLVVISIPYDLFIRSQKLNDFHIHSIGVQWHCEAMNQYQPIFKKSPFGYRYFTISLLLPVRNVTSSRLQWKVDLLNEIKSCLMESSE